MKVARILLASCIASSAGALFSWEAKSHHGFDGRYDLSAPVWLQGLVVHSYFGQPHAELVIETSPDLAVPDQIPDLAAAASFLAPGALTVRPETRGRHIKVELPPTSQFFTLGQSIADRDTVALIALRNCEAPHQLNVQWVQVGDDPPVARSRPMSYMASEC